MPLVYLETKPCERCRDAELCQFARDEVRRSVAHVNLVAEIAQRRLPDADVAFECQSYAPRKRRP